MYVAAECRQVAHQVVHQEAHQEEVDTQQDTNHPQIPPEEAMMAVEVEAQIHPQVKTQHYGLTPDPTGEGQESMVFLGQCPFVGRIQTKLERSI